MQGIYIIRCTKNNKVYVGQTSNFRSRINSHRCSLRNGVGIQKMQSDWDLYGEDCFVSEFICECTSKNDRNIKEKYYIQQFNSIKNGYNTNTGGIGQGNFNYLNGMYGKHHTEKSKQLMSKNRKGLTCGENNPMYGKHHSQAVKDKISKSNKGRVQSDDERAMRKLAMQKAMTKPENQRIKKEQGMKRRIYTDEFILQLREEYNKCGSIKEVAENNNLIYEVCRQAIRGYGRYGRI